MQLQFHAKSSFARSISRVLSKRALAHTTHPATSIAHIICTQQADKHCEITSQSEQSLAAETLNSCSRVGVCRHGRSVAASSIFIAGQCGCTGVQGATADAREAQRLALGGATQLCALSTVEASLARLRDTRRLEAMRFLAQYNSENVSAGGKHASTQRCCTATDEIQARTVCKQSASAGSVVRRRRKSC